MKRSVIFCLALCLLCAQFSALSHASEHDFEKHEHHGQLCSFYSFSQQSDDPLLTSSSAPTLPQVLRAKGSVSNESTFHYSPIFSHRARAPPTTSLY